MFSNISLTDVLNVGTAVVSVASIIVAGTPTPATASTLGKLYQVLELLSLTIGKAKDKGE
jgi:hypothetical protein